MRLFLFYIEYHLVTVIIRATTPEEASELCLNYLMSSNLPFEFDENDFEGTEPIELQIPNIGSAGLVYSDVKPLPDKFTQYLLNL